MTRIENTYFKATAAEGNIYISGRALPDILGGPFLFINCRFHPCLDDHIIRYTNKGSIIVNNVINYNPIANINL